MFGKIKIGISMFLESIANKLNPTSKWRLEGRQAFKKYARSTTDIRYNIQARVEDCPYVSHTKRAVEFNRGWDEATEYYRKSIEDVL